MQMFKRNTILKRLGFDSCDIINLQKNYFWHVKQMKSNYNRQTTNKNRRKNGKRTKIGDTQKKESEKGSGDYGIERNQWVSVSVSWQRRTNRKIKRSNHTMMFWKGKQGTKGTWVGSSNVPEEDEHGVLGKLKIRTFGGHTLWQSQ